MPARLCLALGAAALVAACALLDPATRGFTGREARHRSNDPAARYQARVTLTFPAARYYLGEPIWAEYRVTNLGTVPFPATRGGDYRGAPRHIRFQVTATDAAGRACLDPHPDPWCD